jgi:hypothetical protein
MVFMTQDHRRTLNADPRWRHFTPAQLVHWPEKRKEVQVWLELLTRSGTS